jgi:hypothetical protein
MSDEVTIERLERGLVVLAYIMSRDGPVVAPLFERLERDLAAMRGNEAAIREGAARQPSELGVYCVGVSE